MSNQELFQINCLGCHQPLEFTLQALEEMHLFSCSECGKAYGFGQETLKRQLRKFAALCRQIHDSQEILGNAGVAVTVGSEEVQIPFKLLLSRLKSTLVLQIGSERLVVSFRVEPVALLGSV